MPRAVQTVVGKDPLVKPQGGWTVPRQCSAPCSAPPPRGPAPLALPLLAHSQALLQPPTPDPRLLPQYQDRRSCWGTQWPPSPVQHPGLYTALHHVTHPLPNGLTPSRTCSLPSKHHRCVQSVLTPPRHPLAPTTAAHCNTRTGPAPPNAPRGSSAVPLAMLPCCEHPPHHIPCKLGTCTMAGPCSPSWGTALGTWSTGAP